MITRWPEHGNSAAALLGVPALILACLTVAAAVPAAATPAPAAPGPAFTVAPRTVNNLDCNGWSRRYQPLMPAHRNLCTDPAGLGYSSWSAGRRGRLAGRFLDNGHYVGHDEPSVKFESRARGSGNTMTYYLRLPVNPRAAATSTGSVTTYAELSPAPWFGLPLCDPASYPQNACRPHSDRNSGDVSNPADAGSAFMELQFYPPVFTPFADNVSCDKRYWCAAVTIDSLESKFGYRNLNPNCTEPINFAYLQTNGVPTGPPSPQLANLASSTPNRHTLRMRGGDVLRVSISDPLHGRRAGFTARVTDMTTGRTGYMIASAGNGFMDTNYRTCRGRPFTFHAEYATARAANSVPWALLDGGVLMQQEIGHSEICAALTNTDAYTQPGFADPAVADTCLGGPSESQAAIGEGPCNPNTGDCAGATTQGGQACPTSNAGSGSLCEFADGYCLPAGIRTVHANGHASRETMPVNFCEASRFQNGDLDFDGTDYLPGMWPDGASSHPSSFRYVGPFDAAGKLYPMVQFETDVLGSEARCDFQTGAGCTVPPTGAAFYPYWSMTSRQGLGNGLYKKACVWNFGATIRGVTTRTFGRARQYGHPEFSRIPGSAISRPMVNPQLGCRRS